MSSVPYLLHLYAIEVFRLGGDSQEGIFRLSINTDELVAMVEVQRAFGRAANAMSMIEQSYRRLSRIQ